MLGSNSEWKEKLNENPTHFPCKQVHTEIRNFNC